MISIEAKPNLLLIKVAGFIQEQEASKFIQDYNAKLKEINPAQTNLILDGKGLKTSAQDMLPILEGCLKMYVKDNFKKIFLIKLDSAIAMMQLEKLSKSTGFVDKIVIVDTADQALKQI